MSSGAAGRWLLLYPQLAALCRQVQRRTSLSMTEIAVLFSLHDAGITDVRDLRRSVAADAGHLSRILAKFERGGLVTRAAPAGDGRVGRVALTALGAERCLAVSAVAAETAREVPHGSRLNATGPSSPAWWSDSASEWWAADVADGATSEVAHPE